MALAAQEIIDAGDAITRRVDRPNPQVAHTSACQCASLEKMVECGMRGMRIGVDAAGDLARVQLLPRHADKQIESSSRGRASPQELSDDRHSAILQQSL